MREIMTPEQVAEELGVSAKTLAKWRHFHTGPKYFKLGGTHRSHPVRYRRSDVNEWLDAQEVRV
jgi:predicted DNA-binding transcriptional regulator AlpA